MKKRLLCTFLAAVMLFSFCACSTGSQPERAVERLESAVNSRDISEMIGCLDPKLQKLCNGALAVGSAIFGKDVSDTSDILKAAGNIAQLFGIEDIDGVLPRVEMVVNSAEQLSDIKYRLNVTVYYTYDNDEIEDFETTMDIYVIYQNDEWYITTP